LRRIAQHQKVWDGFIFESPLVDAGATVLMIEHNLGVIKYADWVLGFGPEDGCGIIVATGTSKKITQCEQSHTGRYLNKIFWVNKRS
jgi:excinuclease UvrABC ATPase subunit